MKSALLINGSPHRTGQTASIMEKIEQQINRSYICEWIHVYDLNIHPCIGCNKCRPDSECFLQEDDGQRIGRKISDADLLLIGSPVYWGNITAPLKMLFDRNVTTFEHFLNDGPQPKLENKEAIIIVTGGAGADVYNDINQGGGAIQAIKTVLDSGGIKVINIINIYSSWDIENRTKDVEETIKSIRIK